MRMSNFLQRLKKRKIVQWAIAYAAGAWLSLEVFDLIAEQFFWPMWMRQGATVLLLFGLLVTIVLAWYHGERGRQRVGAVEFILLVVLLAIGGNTVWFLRDRSFVSSVDPDVVELAFRGAPLPEHSVAVLPCLNLGADDGQSYFADALAAELITRLSAVGTLRVPSHTSSFSFKNKSVGIKTVASSLQVRHVLECDVSGDESRIKVSARLVDAQTGYTLWTDSYNRSRENLFDVQQEVALAVVGKLDIRLQSQERLLVQRRWTENADAYDQFLRGISYQVAAPSAKNLANARQHLERSVELDPNFGRAYARLATHWVVLGNYSLVPPGEAYAEVERLSLKAIELDSELFEAYWSLGWAKFVGRYDWQGAAHDFRRVIDLAPGEWAGYHSLGFVQGVLGHIPEAMEAARIAVDLNPLAFWPRRGLEALHTRQRDYEAAIRNLQVQAELQGWFPLMRARFALLLAVAGRELEAREQLSKLGVLRPEDPSTQLMMARAFAALGDNEKALTVAKKWENQWGQTDGYVSAGDLAAIYAELDDSDRAMQWLVKSRDNRDIVILFLDDPFFDKLRDDPRFADFVRELNLPENVYFQTIHNPLDPRPSQ